MIVLLVSYYVDHLVDWVILEAHLSSTDILSHINTGSIATKQQLLIETFVSQVGPNRVVLVALKKSFCEPLFYLSLTFQIGLALVVYLIETNAHLLVSFVETCIYPVVHLLPKGTNLRVVILPFHQHLVSFLNKRSLLLGFLFVHALSNQLLDFLTIVLIESYVVVANQMVALLTA